VIFALLGVGQTVGEMSLFARGARSANVLTMEPSCFLCMSGSSFERTLHTLPALSFNLNALLCARLRLANQQILALASLDVAGRVAREILSFAKQFGRPADVGEVHIPLRLTQSDLAAIVGTSRERVNQVIVGFKQRGYLSVDRSYHITVHNRAALARRCNGLSGSATAAALA
jgi:CRP/FNR family cyclic AMP-dependent transcriptional regulator